MRIAQVAPPAAGAGSGVQTVVEQLAAALALRGHDVVVCHVGGDSGAPVAGARRLDEAGVGRRSIPARRRRGNPLPALDLSRVGAADVVHLHSVFVPSNTALARAWQAPVVVSPHGGYDPVSLRRSRLRKRAYAALFERRMVRRAALVAALTDVEAAQVRRFAGPLAVVVIPNGVMPSAAPGDGDAFRSALGVARQQRLALFVGRLDVRHKGLDRLVRALAAAPSWRLVLVGPDHRGGGDDLERLAAGVGASARIDFAGVREGSDLADAHAAADVFVLPSRWEGLPMSLLEALAAGTPALVSPEVDRLVPIGASGAGWVTAPEDLGPALEGLAALPAAEWDTRGDAARLLARRYDWDRVAAAYEDAYTAAFHRWNAGDRRRGGRVDQWTPT